MFLHLCGFGRGFGDSGRFRAKVPQKYGTLSTPLDNLKTRCDPHMALIPGRNRLTCFYCGVKSSQRQDGHTRRWECRSCESVNYLDENGEITDPPADTFSTEPSPPPRNRFAQKVEEPVFDIFPRQNNVESPFCDTCVRNQNMYYQLLRSYEPRHMGVDPKNPYTPDRDFLRRKKELQREYPQVCADCQRGVEERIRKANRMAKAEVLRHKLSNTKSKHETVRTRSWVEFFALLGGVIYWAATAGQLLVCLLELFKGVMPTISTTCFSTPTSFDDTFGQPATFSSHITTITACSVLRIVSWFEAHASGLHYLEPLSILLTCASFWWNPYYRNMVRGFDSHIHGFWDWYKYQMILLVTRIVYWTFMGQGQFRDVSAPASLGANAFMLIFTVLIAQISRQSIKVDFRKLFPNTYGGPDVQESPVSAAKTSVYKNEGLGSLLDSIAAEPPRRHAIQSFSKTRYNASDPPISPPRQSSLSPTTKFMSSMNEDEALKWLTKGELPSHMRQDEDEDAMDWSPSRHLSEFKPNPRQVKVSVESAAAADPPQQNAFWYKVPPAPIAPSHKARQPFQKPLFQPVSEAKKENFFNSMTGRSNGFGQKSLVEEARTMDMAPAKFYPQNAFASTGLEDLMQKSWNIKSGDDSNAPNKSGHAVEERQGGMPTTTSKRGIDWKARLSYVLALTMMLFTWNLAFTSNHIPNPKPIILGILSLCLALALRTLADNAITDYAKHNPGPRTAIPMILGGCEAAFAIFALLGILTDGARDAAGSVAIDMVHGIDPDWHTKGGLLVAGMWVQEVWLLLF